MADASSSSSCQWTYDVFLSFRGEDTRNNFTAHLYDALCRKGINTFIDDDELKRGEVISSALVTAIENSMFSIIVLSENYASSKWCLEELVKILECMETRGQRVIPIFYNVDPSDVRKQKGKFGEALAKHDMKENMERVKIWRAALTQVSNLSGWDSRNKNEPMIIKGMVKDILNKLLSTFTSDTKNLVGIDSHMQQLKMLLCLEAHDVRTVGIWGMGGIGKTTLARAIYNRIANQFEACSFLENVAEDFEKQGFIGLQEKLLSQLLEEENLNIKRLASIKARLHSKRVLIILDNVSDPTILECLIGNQNWFGQGSRIIITTRDRRLLISHGVIDYEAQTLNKEEALEFLTRYSLKYELPRDDFMELTREIIPYAQGLPLALKVLSSFLFSMNKNEWRNQLQKLKSTPNKKIQEVLRMSYDGLDEQEKNIFLDIACFFKGMDKDYVMEILDGCGFFPFCGLRTLIDRSLVTIFINKLNMHDLIQEMGKEIILQQSLKEPGKRSRLWFDKDICDILKKNTGTEEVEGLFLDILRSKEISLTTEAFARMNKLRLLKVYSSDFRDSYKVHLSQDFKFYHDELRYLHLHGCSLKLLPNDFNPKNLVAFSMPYSHIKQLWKGVKVLEKLKFMDLSHSKYLTQTPDFSGVTNLECLVLEGCMSLCKVHSSLGDLNKLNILSLKNCQILKNLPSNIGSLKSLETFILSGCSKFEEFPENFGNLEMLKELHADRTAIRVLPSSFSLLRNLQVLSFQGCKELPPTPWFLWRRNSSSIGFTLPPLSGLYSLTCLNLSDCNILDGGKLSNLSLLPTLRILNLSRNNFITLSSSIGQLSKLIKLELENCRRLQALPELPLGIKEINAHNCTSLETISNQSLYFPLRSTMFTNCFKLKEHHIYRSPGPLGLRQMDQIKEGIEWPVPALNAIVAGSRIPDWISHQSSGREVELELPPNWFNTNFLGFSLSAVASLVYLPSAKPAPRLFLPTMKCTLFYSTPSNVSFSQPAAHFAQRRMKSDHVWLLYVPYLPCIKNNASHIKNEVSHIKASFEFTMISNYAIKRCGVALVYRNQEVCDNYLRRIQSNSNFPPRPHSSTHALKKIEEREPDASGCSSYGPESLNITHHDTADERDCTASGCTTNIETVPEIQPTLPISICWNGVLGFFIMVMSKLGCGCFDMD